jgi:hypothetical protein
LLAHIGQARHARRAPLDIKTIVRTGAKAEKKKMLIK